MKVWQEELLHVAQSAECEHQLLDRIGIAARSLGFEYCAYGIRIPRSFNNPKTVLLNNYPQAWQQRYDSQDYLHIDPTVEYCRRHSEPLVWTDALFASTRTLWEDAKDHGLRHGWAQSCVDGLGIGGMLTLARSAEPLTMAWLAGEELKMRWLACVAHQSLSRLLRSRHGRLPNTQLSRRELEVLKWTADGKTSGEIASILALSENTVNFHIKNAIAKLRACNKTSAVVQAAMQGLLS